MTHEVCDQPLQGTELQGREEKEQKCPGIVLKFFLALKIPWNWEIKQIVLEIRPFTFFLSWKIFKCDFLKSFDH